MRLDPAILLAVTLLLAAGLVAAAGVLVPGGRAATVRPTAGAAARAGCLDGAGTVGLRWQRLLPRVGDGGDLTGWALRLGWRDGHATTFDLPPESAVDGPVDGLVAVADDDGRTSTIRLVGDGACTTTVARSRDVVRAVALDPAGRRVAVHRVARGDREDLGVVVVELASGSQLAVVPPPTDADLAAVRLERAWRTVLRWDRGGGRLAIQSCEPRGCLTRLVDPISGAVMATVAATADLVELDDGRLVAWDRCAGLPCPLLSIDVATGRSTVLEPAATVARAAGSGLVAVVAAARPDAVRVHGMGGPGPVERRLPGHGTAPVAGSTRSATGVELPAGWIPLAGDGGDPDRALRIADGTIARLEEVAP